jgi:hypothetical protein
MDVLPRHSSDEDNMENGMLAMHIPTAQTLFCSYSYLRLPAEMVAASSFLGCKEVPRSGCIPVSHFLSFCPASLQEGALLHATPVS